MESPINIASWNLCLGLANKKDSVIEYLTSNNVHLCCLQETEIPMGFPESVLNCKGYNVELEQNTVKKRVGIYVHKEVNYTRRFDLERENLHVNKLMCKSTTLYGGYPLTLTVVAIIQLVLYSPNISENL